MTPTTEHLRQRIHQSLRTNFGATILVVARRLKNSMCMTSSQCQRGNSDNFCCHPHKSFDQMLEPVRDRFSQEEHTSFEGESGPVDVHDPVILQIVGLKMCCRVVRCSRSTPAASRLCPCNATGALQDSSTCLIRRPRQMA